MKKIWSNYTLVVSILVIIFLFITNNINSPQHPWAYYAVMPVLLIDAVIIARDQSRSIYFSIVGAIITILYYVLIYNYTQVNHPYYIYIAYPATMWPVITMFLRNKNHVIFSIIAYIITAVFLYIVNMVTSPSSIWYIYPAFGLILWPITAIFMSFNKKTTA